jgi:predicted lipoprotein with Yx(FWY)xxD motif
MSRQLPLSRARIRRPLLTLVIAAAGFGTAALVGVAIAKSFTLKVAKNATVTNTKGATVHEDIVVNGRGRAVYTLSGDSKRHPKCTKASGCFMFWPPVKVASASKLSKAPGIHGKLGVWHRNGFAQVTLGGHPLYTYSGDKQKATATGEGIHTFGGTWHVSRTSGPRTTLPPPGPTSSTTPTYTYTTTSTTTTIPYP